MGKPCKTWIAAWLAIPLSKRTEITFTFNRGVCPMLSTLFLAPNRHCRSCAFCHNACSEPPKPCSPMWPTHCSTFDPVLPWDPFSPYWESPPHPHRLTFHPCSGGSLSSCLGSRPAESPLSSHPPPLLLTWAPALLSWKMSSCFYYCQVLSPS